MMNFSTLCSRRGHDDALMQEEAVISGSSSRTEEFHQSLQLIQNAAARDHMTPEGTSLHRLPIKSGTDVQFLFLT